MLLIDEMAALGRLNSLEVAFGLVRGYRLQIVGTLGDLTRLQELYEKRWESLLARAGVLRFFTPNDLTSAKWMSERSGQTTIVVRGENENSGPTGAGTTVSWAQASQMSIYPTP
jgi:type IV secretion system protein VirD4